MAYDKETLEYIYRKTDGYCHICKKKLSLKNYARQGYRGAWEVEHSNPKAGGGTDYLRNLFPACINCNREKGAVTTRTARTWHGRKRTPLSKKEKDKKRTRNTMLGGAVGALGFAINPLVGVIGIVVGGLIGSNVDPDSK